MSVAFIETVNQSLECIFISQNYLMNALHIFDFIKLKIYLNRKIDRRFFLHITNTSVMMNVFYMTTE